MFFHFDWSPLRDELAILSANPTARLFRANGAGLVEVSGSAPTNLPVVDFTWANWGMPKFLGVYSTLVSK